MDPSQGFLYSISPSYSTSSTLAMPRSESENRLPDATVVNLAASTSNVCASSSSPGRDKRLGTMAEPPAPHDLHVQSSKPVAKLLRPIPPLLPSTVESLKMTHVLSTSSPPSQSQTTKSDLHFPPLSLPLISDRPTIVGSFSVTVSTRELDDPTPAPLIPEPTVSQEKLRITTETPIDDIIDYFERVAKLDNYTSRLVHDQWPASKRHGGTADVYQVPTKDNTHVAVKCIYLRARAGGIKGLKRSARELEVWSKLKHKNILPLLGVAKYQDSIAMVSNWMSLGSVVTFVNDRPDENRYLLSKQVVEAVGYLHAQDIVHGDIKGDNVLMSDDGKPMLTDFGLTIMIESHLVLSATTGGGGTTRWMAPELFETEGVRSKEADVYALGMTILEILTGEPPFAEIIYSYNIPDVVRGQRKTPRRPECLTPPSELKDAYWGAMTKCWTYEPTRRAKVTEIEELLEHAVEQGETGAGTPTQFPSPHVQPLVRHTSAPATPREESRRRELVKAILESGKNPPITTKRIWMFRERASSHDTEAQANLVRLEKRVRQGADAANAMAEQALNWTSEITTCMVRLVSWGRAFARVVDTDVLLGGEPQGGSEAVWAFIAAAASLEDLSRELFARIKEEVVPQLRRLVKTTQGPLLLLAHMHTLPSTHQAYLALASQLREELPRYVEMFERALGVIILGLSRWQARYFQETQRHWQDFWLMLNAGGSEVGEGESAAVQTMRIWWIRWETIARQMAGMSIVTMGKRVYTRQSVSPALHPTPQDCPSKSFAPPLSNQQSAEGRLPTVPIDQGPQPTHGDSPEGKSSRKGSLLQQVANMLFDEAIGEPKLASAYSSSSRTRRLHGVPYTADPLVQPRDRGDSPRLAVSSPPDPRCTQNSRRDGAPIGAFKLADSP